jgi:hypothetical protein
VTPTPRPDYQQQAYLEGWADIGIPVPPVSPCAARIKVAKACLEKGLEFLMPDLDVANPFIRLADPATLKFF